jgi:hypothetical protein
MNEKDKLKDLSEIHQILSGSVISEKFSLDGFVEWNDGDKVFGVVSFNLGSSNPYSYSWYKTYQEKSAARKAFDEAEVANRNLFDTILYTGNIEDSSELESEERNDRGLLTNVEILGRKVYHNTEVMPEYTISDI